MELKNKCVDAEALERFLQETKFTAEAKVMALCALLRGGSLPRIEAPKGRGRGDYDAARAQLREQKVANAPMRKPNVLELKLEADLFKGLSPKEHNAAAKRQPAKSKPEAKPADPS